MSLEARAEACANEMLSLRMLIWAGGCRHTHQAGAARPPVSDLPAPVSVAQASGPCLEVVAALFREDGFCWACVGQWKDDVYSWQKPPSAVGGKLYSSLHKPSEFLLLTAANPDWVPT